MIAKIQSANGVEGVIIRTGGEYMFRVYTDTIGEFKDYYLDHSDLVVTINDPDATFYEYEDGTMSLDHTPETLGL